MRSFLGFQNILSYLLFKSQEKRKDIGQNSKKITFHLHKTSNITSIITENHV